MEQLKVYSKKDLKLLAKEIRKMILKVTHNAGVGHTGGSLSETEILVALYFRELNIDPHYPDMRERDRFILSKGHATPGFYSVLAKRGYFDVSELDTFDKENSRLQGHPDMNKCPGVEVSTGSLGQGLSLGIGMSLGRIANNEDWYTWVLMGDGEMQEGQVWEAFLYAGAHKISHLLAVIDYNKVQLASSTKDTLDLEPLVDKLRSFRWEVLSCNGNSIDEVVDIFDRAKNLAAKGPVVVIANTVKGKGVSFMENKCMWHGKAPNNEEYRIAIKEIESEGVEEYDETR